jgi:hypothetical protein
VQRACFAREIELNSILVSHIEFKMTDKKISKLVADSAAFIRNAQMQVIGDRFITMFLSCMLLVDMDGA